MANALDALPRFTAMEAFIQGVQARNQNALAKLDMQAKRNALADDGLERIARGVIGSDNPERDWPLALRQVQQMGRSIEGLPTEWGPQAELVARMYAMPVGERTEFERLLQRAQSEYGWGPEQLEGAIRQRLMGKPERPDVREFDGNLIAVDPEGTGFETLATGRPKPPDHPSSVDEYLFAIENDGFTGTYQDWLGAKQGQPDRDIRNDPRGVPRYVDTGDPVFPGVEPEPDRPSSMQEKIGLLESAGVDRETAIGIATGRLVTSRDPITGAVTVVDKATGQPVGPLPQGAAPLVSGGGSPAGAAGSGRPSGGPVADNGQRSPAGNLYDRTGEGTGVLSGAKELSSNTLGQLPGAAGDFFSFPATTETRQAFRAATGDLVRAFSVNPRYPVAEISRIRDQLGVEPSIWTDPEALQGRMRAIDAYLRNKLAAERQAANDPTLPADQRQAAIGTARAIEQYLGLLGVPQGGGQGQPDIPEVRNDADYEALPSGTPFRAPDGTLRMKP